jgi:uncharacterized protein YbjT (DUF2867 family)
MPKSCVVLGGTGLIGGHLLRLVAADPAFDRVTAFSRRPIDDTPAGVEVRQVDLGEPDGYRDALGVDVVFCCLGTTIRKAGSKEAFRRVDHDYPVTVAKAACEAGARRYVIVTAVGADPDSSIFYNRVKGEVEAALFAVGFVEGVVVIRPSMLLGDRGESRPAEKLGGLLMKVTAPVFGGPLKKYRAIEAETVARAMRAAGRELPPGDQTFEGQPLFDLAG